MSLLWKVVVASACRNTHHHLAMEALRHLRGPNADLWQNIFLKNYESYLAGSKAPDDQFKDFKNHVLHVGDNFWGGAINSAKLWYERMVLAMRKGYWADVTYSAGVLSHYYTDPHMPFHTGQTEEEGKVHRAVEWSISCCYAELQSIQENDLGGYPEVTVPAGPDWLAEMIKRGAQLANAHYHTLIEHYDLKKGIKTPTAGLDQESKDIIAALLGYAAVGFSRVLEKAAADTKAIPPWVDLTVDTFLATVKIPIRHIKKQLAEERDQDEVQRIYDEVRKTGKVIQNLPEDDKQVRRMYAEQVLKVPVEQLDAAPPRPVGLKHGTGATPRDQDDPIVDHGPIPLKSKAKITKVDNPLFRKAIAARPTTPAGVRPLSRSLATGSSTPLIPSNPIVPIGRLDASDDEESFPINRPTDDEPEFQETDIAATEQDVDQPARRRWFRRPDLSFITKRMPKLPSRMPTFGMGKLIATAKSIPGRLRLKPLGTPKDIDANSSDDTDTAVKVKTHRVALDVADEADAVEFKSHSKNPLATDAPRRRTDLEVTTKPGKDDKTSSRNGPQSPAPSDLKFHLNLDQPLEAAPSIGPKLAKRFEAFGVRTVRDFLNGDPEKISAQLNIKTLDAQAISDWQSQAELACRIPKLRGHDAQILVACGVTDPADLARLDERELFELVTPFVASSDGKRILRNGTPPDLEEVREWIECARHARSLKAA